MKDIPDGSIDMILTDLPYGTTECKWDAIIPFKPLWEQYERIIKPRGAMVFTAAQPFTTSLINSNRRQFRYCWYWIKNQVTGFPFAKLQPLRCVEDVVVFYKAMPTYNAQGLIRLEKPQRSPGKRMRNSVYRAGSLGRDTNALYTNYPRQTLYIKCQREGLHPTQKPVELMEYFIRTYTNPGETVFDGCAGSGTTGKACINSGRNYILMEKDPEIYKIAKQQLELYQARANDL